MIGNSFDNNVFGGPSCAAGFDGVIANEELIDEVFCNHLYMLADRACEHAESRNAGLNNLAGHLLTSIGLLSVAYLTPLSIIVEELSTGPLTCSQCAAGICFGASILLVMLAAALVLVALLRRKGKDLDSPASQADSISIKVGELKEKATACNEGLSAMSFAVAKSYCSAIDDYYIGMSKKSAWMERFLKIALSLTLSSIALMSYVAFYCFR